MVVKRAIKCFSFSHGQISFQNKIIIFLKRNQIKNIMEVGHNRCMSPKLLESQATSYLPVFFIGALKLNKILSVKLSSRFKTYQSRVRAPS